MLPLSPEKTLRRVRGLAVGLVSNNQDDEGLGRVKVLLPWLGEGVESDWARVAQPMAGKGRGFWFVPEVGDEVLLAFEHGDVHRPFVLGVLWNEKDRPPSLYDVFCPQCVENPSHIDSHAGAFNADGKNDKKYMRSRSGHMIVFDDNSGVTIADKTGKHRFDLVTEEKKVKLSNADGNSLMNAPSGGMSLSAKQIDIQVLGDATLGAKGNLVIKSAGKMIFDSRGKLEFKAGGMTSLSAGGGPLVIQGSKGEVTAAGAFAASGGGEATLVGGGPAMVQGTQVMLQMPGMPAVISPNMAAGAASTAGMAMGAGGMAGAAPMVGAQMASQVEGATPDQTLQTMGACTGPAVSQQTSSTATAVQQSAGVPDANQSVPPANMSVDPGMSSASGPTSSSSSTPPADANYTSADGTAVHRSMTPTSSTPPASTSPASSSANSATSGTGSPSTQTQAPPSAAGTGGGASPSSTTPPASSGGAPGAGSGSGGGGPSSSATPPSGPSSGAAGGPSSSSGGSGNSSGASSGSGGSGASAAGSGPSSGSAGAASPAGAGPAAPSDAPPGASPDTPPPEAAQGGECSVDALKKAWDQLMQKGEAHWKGNCDKFATELVKLAGSQAGYVTGMPMIKSGGQRSSAGMTMAELAGAGLKVGAVVHVKVHHHEERPYTPKDDFHHWFVYSGNGMFTDSKGWQRSGKACDQWLQGWVRGSIDGACYEKSRAFLQSQPKPWQPKVTAVHLAF